ncbi:NADH-quinone oxidoreductase subunit G [Kluyvera cryocrescens]|uniref:NADH-quinone oxidoreductase subunit G n=1 Tax=Kluyvera cryocrescens TaxID=580 RepID=A0A485AWI2_KLUCR|nr:NADH-quinone oxidoreductase subunit G [Kluyvera cryocrescens]
MARGTVTTTCSAATKCRSARRYSRRVCRSLTSSSTRQMPRRLAVNAGAKMALSYDGQTVTLPLVISSGLVAGQVGLPMGMPGIAPVLAGARLENLQEAQQ